MHLQQKLLDQSQLVVITVVDLKWQHRNSHEALVDGGENAQWIGRYEYYLGLAAILQ